MITPEQLAERMKKDILADLLEGISPNSVGNFSELHDYVDANCYGGTEAILAEMDAAVADTDEGRAFAMNSFCDLMTPAIAIVDEWIVNGGAIRDLSVCSTQ